MTTLNTFTCYTNMTEQDFENICSVVPVLGTEDCFMIVSDCVEVLIDNGFSNEFLEKHCNKIIEIS